MHARRSLAPAALFLAALLTVAMATPASAGDVAGSRSLVGSWRTAMLGVPQSITFTANGQVSGSAGCNRFTGGYTTHGTEITIGTLAVTAMACDEETMGAEATFLTRLQAAVGYHATHRVLKLFAPKDILRFVAAR